MSASSGLVPSINNVKTPKTPSAPYWESIPLVEGVETKKHNGTGFSDLGEGSCEVHNVDARMTRMRRNLGTSAVLHSMTSPMGLKGFDAFMLTFTYADESDWSPSHIRDALRRLRQLVRARGHELRYCWVMEMKKRKSGSRVGEPMPHYHCVVWLPKGHYAATEGAAKLAGFGVQHLELDTLGYWPHGLTNSCLAVAPVRYIMGYATKGEKCNEGPFPHGARIYGVGGLDATQRGHRRWGNYPRFIRQNAAISDRWVRAPGGGWTDPHGRHWPSEWALVGRNALYTQLIRVHQHPWLMPDPVGAFCWLGGDRPSAAEHPAPPPSSVGSGPTASAFSAAFQ